MFEAKLIIRGAAIDALDGAIFERRSPVADRIATRASAASQDDARAAADAAAAAFPSWSAMPAGERAAILERTADLVVRRDADFVASMMFETGGSDSWARFNCELGARILREAAKLCDRPGTSEVPCSEEGVRSWISRQPAGVVLGIAPWNAPVILGLRAIAAPLALGNTAVLKASELCPKTHSLLVECLMEAGLPGGAANLVIHAPEQARSVVSALIGHPAVRRVNFTGSTRVGREVAEICARNLKPCLLELSGKAPLIVLADADIAEAARAAVFGAFYNQGQICIATDRVIVDERIADAFVDAFLARTRALCSQAQGMGAAGPLGALIGPSAMQRQSALIEDALARGAVLVAGGRADGAAMEPTILDHISPAMRLWREEAFGPIASVIRVSGEDEAISVANDSDHGLAAAIFSADTEHARALAGELETGICHINGPTIYDDPAMPFGGMKDSGYGRFGGEAAVHEFTEVRWISQRDRPRAWPI